MHMSIFMLTLGFMPIRFQICYPPGKAGNSLGLQIS